MSIDEILKFDYKSVLDELMSIEERRTELRTKLLEYTKETGRIQTDNYTVCYHPEVEFVYLDKELLKKKNPELYQECIKSLKVRPEYISIIKN